MHNITYTYDPVGNITRISNAAGGADGLGGSFTYNYSYDDLYRLSSSDGSGAIDAAYTLAMEYSPSGNILKKTLSASKELLGNATMESYENEYNYGGAHTLAGVNDMLGGAPPLTYNFDGSGNMVMQQLYNPSNGQVNERYLCWDEENRLSATRDYNYVTANIYDASGNRSWTLRRGSAQALAGEMNWMWQNGSGWQGYGDLNLRTWYQSELMTITDVGFTKHYFIAGQKIASKLGEGFRNSDELHPLKGAPLEPIYSDYTALARAQVNRLQRDFDCLGVSYGNFNPGEGNFRLLDDYEVIEIGEESDIYFYHSDHLGSSSFLTDGGGVATQHLQYMPFGEDLVHQQNTAAYYTPYAFSGKERDFETGLSYFGARYYDAGLSIWLSVDPMSDKYPSLSAYNYCAWNPVMLVDPDGREIETTEEGWKIISAALVATLGKNHPFSWNKETGKVEFDGKADLTGFKKDTQKEIIDKYKTLVEKKDFNVNVQVKGNDEEIQDQNGGITTLRQQEARGLTVLSADGKSANVYISEEPLYKQDGKWFVNPQKQDEQGITSLHEIGGHAYYFSQGIYNTGPNGKENNRLTSEFEGRARQVFKGKNLTNYIKKQPITYHR